MADELISRQALIDEINDQRRIGRTSTPKFTLDIGDAIQCIYDAPSVNAVVLPCEVDDTAWYADEDTNRVLMGYISEYQLLSGGAIYFEFTNVESDIEWVSVELPVEEFGRTVFLTREEAEAALERGVNDGLL